MPKASQIFRHRSANLPDSSTIAFPPRGTRFTTAASIAPVPELVSTSTSFCGGEDVLQPGEHLGQQAAELGRAMVGDLPGHASRAGSGTSVGPGVIRRCLLVLIGRRLPPP